MPPLDVAWVWHCHRLSPLVYERDIAALTDAALPIDCSFGDAFRFSDGEDAQSARVRMLWKNAFPFEDFMPRYLQSWSWEEEERFLRSEITTYSNEMLRAGFKSVISTDVIERVAALQMVFLWQVVGQEGDKPPLPATESLVETNEYIGRAHDRYLLFLDLHKKAERGTLLVPMSDINIIWHAHLSCSYEYKLDCMSVLGWVLDHDTVGVEERRNRRTAAILAAAARTADSRSSGDDPSGAGGGVAGALDAALGDGASDMGDDEVGSLGLPSAELADMDEAEIEALLEKRRRGISVRETKTLWESTYGAYPKYDLPDTLYRGEPEGDRGGFYAVFEKTNGTTNDISWVRALFLMLFAVFVCIAGLIVASWAFMRAMLSHAKFLPGIPVGLALAGLGVYLFLAIPINRPLSSDARYWRDRNLKQTHNPLPPYLISSTKKMV